MKQRALIVALGSVLALFLLGPLVVVVASSGLELFSALRHPLVGAALRLSLFTTSTSLALVVGFGLPLAWVVSRSTHRLARVLEAALQLPVVVPPAVAGVALLLTFGRRGVLAPVMGEWAPSFTSAAVVMAEVFVSAPFFLQAAVSAFRRIDHELLDVARSLGAGPLQLLLRVAVPLAWPGLVTGAAMSWARALGEFGATLMFAGNLEGKTQTLPLAIYTALETDLRVAQAISVVLIVAAFTLLLIVRAGADRR